MNSERWDAFKAKYPARRRRERSYLHLQDVARGDDVEVYSENLEVKAKPAREST